MHATSAARCSLSWTHKPSLGGSLFGAKQASSILTEGQPSSIVISDDFLRRSISATVSRVKDCISINQCQCVCVCVWFRHRSHLKIISKPIYINDTGWKVAERLKTCQTSQGEFGTCSFCLVTCSQDSHPFMLSFISLLRELMIQSITTLRPASSTRRPQCHQKWSTGLCTYISLQNIHMRYM